MSLHHCCSPKDPHRHEEEKDDCDYISEKLSLLGQRRRFWRPTIKFLVGKSTASSFITGITFFIFLTCSISKRLTVRGVLVPLALLIIMEAATDLADKHITEVATTILPLPKLVYSLTIATLMTVVEIYLWSFVIKIYHTCNCKR